VTIRPKPVVIVGRLRVFVELAPSGGDLSQSPLAQPRQVVGLATLLGVLLVRALLLYRLRLLRLPLPLLGRLGVLPSQSTAVSRLQFCIEICSLIDVCSSMF